MSILTIVEKADFLYIKNNLGITQGNLSSHLIKLEASGYIEIEKTFKGKRPATLLNITEKGIVNFEKYLKTMKSFIELSGI